MRDIMCSLNNDLPFVGVRVIMCPSLHPVCKPVPEWARSFQALPYSLGNSVKIPPDFFYGRVSSVRKAEE